MPTIQFHTPEGIVTVDTERVTDEELNLLRITREHLAIAKVAQRDLVAELDDLKRQLQDHELRLSKDVAGHTR